MHNVLFRLPPAAAIKVYVPLSSTILFIDREHVLATRAEVTCIDCMYIIMHPYLSSTYMIVTIIAVIVTVHI